MTFYGQRASDPSEATLTAVLAVGGGARRAPHDAGRAIRGYHALTLDVPALHGFERELHEQRA